MEWEIESAITGKEFPALDEKLDIEIFLTKFKALTAKKILLVAKEKKTLTRQKFYQASMNGLKNSMPKKAKRPCRYKNCPALTDSESGYCEQHEKIVRKEINRNYNRYGRSTEAKKRYGYKWRKIRAAFLAANPLCEMCKRQGKYTAANEVHHVKPLADGGTNDFENLMALCKSCHSKITAAAKNFSQQKQGEGAKNP